MDLGFSFERCGSKQPFGFWDQTQNFSCGYWRQMQDFSVNFRSRAIIFIMILEIDWGPMGATTCTWMYLGPPLLASNPECSYCLAVRKREMRRPTLACIWFFTKTTQYNCILSFLSFYWTCLWTTRHDFVIRNSELLYFCNFDLCRVSYKCIFRNFVIKLLNLCFSKNKNKKLFL